jgi:hypothetical protein
MADKQWISLSYSLTYDEAFSAFQRLAARGKPGLRRSAAIALLALSAGLIVLYALYPARLEYFFLPLLCLAMYWGLMYYPAFTARRGARQVAKIGGTYKVDIHPSGLIRAAGEDTQLAGDKDARAFETPALFIIRPDRRHTFCLPKRIMNEAQITELRKTLETHLKKFTQEPEAQ